MWKIGFGDGDRDYGHSLALNSQSYNIIVGAGYQLEPGEDPDEGKPDSDDDAMGHITMARVCENGHLSGAFRGWYPSCESDSEAEEKSDPQAEKKSDPQAKEKSDSEAAEETSDSEAEETKRGNSEHRPKRSAAMVVLNQKPWAAAQGVLKRHYDRSYDMYLGP